MDLSGDGRSDSSGHGAKYMTYSFYSHRLGKIVHTELVQVKEVRTLTTIGKTIGSKNTGTRQRYKVCNILDPFHKVLPSFWCPEVSASSNMGKEGCARGISFLKSRNVLIRSFTTDRHSSIKAYMRIHQPAILHLFDVWHAVKGECEHCLSI